MKNSETCTERWTFSQELRDLAEQFTDRRVRLSELLEATRERGFSLLLVFLCLPFVTFTAIPGLSTPFGAVVTLIGVHLALGTQPWLPRRLMQCELPPGFLARLLKVASRIVRFLEFLLRPRLLILVERNVFQRIAGVLVTVCGFLLLLPLPIPLTNTLPAATVLLLSAGALERDGVFIILGCLAAGLTFTYFGFLAFGGVHILSALLHRL